MLYGYCRISTAQQSIERQVRNILRSFPNAKIVKEVFTGTSLERPEFSKLIKKVSQGDTIIFDSVSRMSRNAEDGYSIYEEIYKRGVDLVFLKEPHINTEVFKMSSKKVVPMTGTMVDIILESVNLYLLELAKQQIRIAFEQSEKEVKDLQKRTSEGIQTARLNGKQIGRQKNTKIKTKKSVKAKDVIREHSLDFGGTLNDTQCIKLIGISRNTYYKYKRELKTEN